MVLETSYSRSVDCAVLIVTYNSEKYIEGLVNSIARESLARVRIVCVDNGSSDETVKILSKYDNVLLSQAPGNVGFAAGLNIAKQVAGEAESYLVINPDSELSEGALKNLVSCLNEDATLGIVVPMLREAGGALSYSLRREPSVVRQLGDALFGARLRTRHSALAETVFDVRRYERAGPVDWATGAAMLIRQRCWEDVGAWDESFFLYSEETDFARRSRSKNWKVWYTPESIVLHVGGGSGASPLLDALLTVNKIRYYRRYNMILKSWIFWLVSLLGAVLRVRTASGYERLTAIWQPHRLEAVFVDLTTRLGRKV